MNYVLSALKNYYEYVDLHITNVFPSLAVISIIVALPLRQPECPDYTFILESMELNVPVETERVGLPWCQSLCWETAPQGSQWLLPLPAASL